MEKYFKNQICFISNKCFKLAVQFPVVLGDG